jgi:UDP-glucose 4-epimerase
MKRVLITGVAGMIGSVLARYFLNKNYLVYGIDNLKNGFLENVPNGIFFYKIDICNKKAINNIFKKDKYDYVIHCAAYAAEILSPFIRNYNYNNNLIGSINIINACINNDVKKIINFSSFATYGKATPPFKETDIRKPKDCYGIAKLAVEMDLKEAYEHFGLKYSTVLPHNVVSKYQNYWDRYRNAIAIWIRQCSNNENITIFGDGLQTRAFSDCKFICEPIEKLLYNFDDQIFNIGSDKIVTIKDAAQLVLSIGEKYGFNKSKLIFLEKRNEAIHAFCDHEKAKSLLQFEDKTNLELLIKEMFEFYLTLKPKVVKYMDYEINKNMYSFWKNEI